MALMAERFSCSASFVIVYVAEAHAEDEWPIKSSRYNSDRGPVLINQHKTTAQRCAAAAAFAADFGVTIPVLVDPVPGDTIGLHLAGQESLLKQGEPSSVGQDSRPRVSNSMPVSTASAADGASCDQSAHQAEQHIARDSMCHESGMQTSGAPPAAAATGPGSNLKSCTTCVSKAQIVGYGNSGPFDAALAPWPLRFYVIDRQSSLRYKADPKDCQYDLLELWQWLEQQQGRQQQQEAAE